MGINCYAGLPGKGKTAESTYFAVKHYNLLNNRINRHVSNILKIGDSVHEYYEYHSKFNLFKMLHHIISSYGVNNRLFKLYPNNNVFSNYPIILNPMTRFKDLRQFIKNTVYMISSELVDSKKIIKFKFIYFKNYIMYFSELKEYFYNDLIYDHEQLKFVPDHGQFDDSDLPKYGKYKIMSNILQLTDMYMLYQFPKHSLLIIDEAQKYQDSRDFASFNRNLGTFLQHHRHATIDDIIFVTQHPRRLDNKIRDLCEVFRKYRMFIKIPFIPFIFATYTNYYEFEDYGRFNQLPKEARTYDYDNHIQILPTNKVFTRYESKYFSRIFEKLPMIQKLEFTDKKLTSKEIEKIGVK